jgi:hypothetical protein
LNKFFEIFSSEISSSRGNIIISGIFCKYSWKIVFISSLFLYLILEISFKLDIISFSSNLKDLKNLTTSDFSFSEIFLFNSIKILLYSYSSLLSNI